MKVKQHRHSGTVVESVEDFVIGEIDGASDYHDGQVEILAAELRATREILARLVGVLATVLDEDDVYKILGRQHTHGADYGGIEVGEFCDECQLKGTRPGELAPHKNHGDKLWCVVCYPEHGVCVYCSKPSEGEHTIHRDSTMTGAELPLCNACGGAESPTCDEIWAKIADENPSS